MENRFDPFYYKPEYRNLISNLTKRTKNIKRLGELADFSKERWDKSKWQGDIFRYIEINRIDIVTGKIQQASMMEVKKSPSRAQMFLRKGDIIISTTRPYRGAIAIIPDKFDKSIGSTGFSILRNMHEKVNKKYLFFILRSNIGLKQMEQRMSGGNYPAITEEELAKIFIPLPPCQIQDKIADIMNEAYKKQREMLDKSEKILSSIEPYLLKELDIIIPSCDEKKKFMLGFDNLRNNRYDVHYHQPKYEKMEDAITNSKYEVKLLGEIVDFSSTQINPEDTPEKKFKYIEIEHVNDKIGQITGHSEINGKDAPSRARMLLHTGDLLISSLQGSLGSIAIVPMELDNSIGTTGFLIISMGKKVNNIFLWGLLRSSIYQSLITREATGAIMAAVTQSQLAKIKIPFPPFSVQNQIANEINFRQKEAEKFCFEAEKVMEEAKQKFEKIALGEIK